MRRVRQTAAGDAYRTAVEPLLPPTASLFFHHYATCPPSTASTLQRTLNEKATSHRIEAAAQLLQDRARGAQGDKWPLAHHRAVTAPGAWTWKTVRPEGPYLRLSDAEYALAARLSLGLRPFPAQARALLPRDCPLCNKHTSLDADPWHWMTCKGTLGEQTRRHDAVVDAISRVARQVGAQVRTEVRGLDASSKQRPDLCIVFPGRLLLSDVAVHHSLTPSAVGESRCGATKKQLTKDAKYARLATRMGAELLNMAIETSGSLTPGAKRLVEAIGEEGARWSAGTWTSAAIQRHLLGAIAVAVQRGDALAILSGYSSAARMTGARGDEAEQ